MNTRSRANFNIKRLLLALALGTAVAITVFPLVASAEGGSTSEPTVTVPPGGILVGDQIIFDGGNTILNLGVTAFDDCPSGWVCLWEHRDWGGRMLQFQDCCWWQSLWTYDFANQASSSRNRKTVNAKIATGVGGGGSQLCMNAGGHFAYLGSVFNDNAESINAGTAC